MKRDLRGMAAKQKGEAPKQGFSEEKLKEKTRELSGLSEDELIKKLFSDVGEAKKTGDFSREKLSEFINKVSPRMNEEQKKKLNDIANKLV